MMTVRVDEDLKERMRRHPKVNWSECIRESLERRVREEEMKEAVKEMDELAGKTTGTWSGAEEIRKWRDKPDGSS
jgi:hypothetical protein